MFKTDNRWRYSSNRTIVTIMSKKNNSAVVKYNKIYKRYIGLIQYGYFIIFLYIAFHETCCSRIVNFQNVSEAQANNMLHKLTDPIS